MRYKTILLPALLLLLAACSATSGSTASKSDWDNTHYDSHVGTDGML